MKVPVNPDTLAKALRKEGLSLEGLARKAKIREEDLRKWVAGVDLPPYEEARRLAKALGIGLPSLLNPCCEREIPLPDLREGGEAPSSRLRQGVYDLLRKASWVKGRNPHPLSLIGRFQKPEEAAQALTSVLGLSSKAPRSPGGERRAFLEAEALGFFVLRRKEASPGRPFDPQEFAGAVLADPEAPFLLVNLARVGEREQVRRLFQGLALALAGQSGIYGGSYPERGRSWVRREQKASPEEALEEAVQLALQGRWTHPLPVGDRPRGYLAVLQARHSGRFLALLEQAWRAGELDVKEAAHLLDVSPGVALSILEKLFPTSGKVFP